MEEALCFLHLVYAQLYCVANRTGKGQVVDAAMVDGVSVLTSIFHSLSQSGVWNEFI